MLVPADGCPRSLESGFCCVSIIPGNVLGGTAWRGRKGEKIMALGKAEQDYLRMCEATRARRMKWWTEARFGMFVHWGLYSQIGRHEWAMNYERIPVKEYEKFAPTWKPKPGAAREWAALAKAAGMKYMVLTTKHHEGFLLWDSKMSDYNAARIGPERDLVREYVDAAREFGLRVGFYYSLMDWHHPDGATCAQDEAARKRFIAYTQGCVRELMSNYGKIDILWYDVSWPLTSPQAWDSYRMNAMVRQLQPHIIINDRSQLPEDLGTPEEHIRAAFPGRSWEACMTFNGSWGWQKAPPEDWHSTRAVLEMLRKCTAGQGNLLLNIGPLPDGSVPAEATERLTAVGRWLKTYGDVVYGQVDRAPDLASAVGKWSRRGDNYYFWCTRWPGRELAIGALTGKLASARLLPNGQQLPFEQVKDRLVIRSLPEKCPDTVAGVALLELKFTTPPDQAFSCGCVSPGVPKAVCLTGKWFSKAQANWWASKLYPRKGDVSKAPCRGLSSPASWQPIHGGSLAGFIDLHDRWGEADGIVYLANRFRTEKAGRWTMHVGHDGGVQVFVDGKRALCVPERVNPAIPGRSQVDVALSKGVHEIVIAFDTDGGQGWGVFFTWGIPKSARKTMTKPIFPERA
jgi:alpha-L-fucosidase